MQSPQVDEAVLVRIKKLLALATSSNPNEAALAASKAQALLTQHNIAMAQVEAVDLRKEGVDRFDWADVVFPSNKSTQWRSTLFGAVAETTYCKCWIEKVRTGGKYDSIGRWKAGTIRKATIIGRPSDVEVAKYLFIYLANAIQREAASHAKAEARPWVKGEAAHLRASFLKGMATVVHHRLMTEWKEARQNAEATNALVVVREGELTDWMEKHNIKFSKSKNYFRGADAASYYAGAAAGRDLSLSKGVTGGEAGSGQRQLR